MSTLAIVRALVSLSVAACFVVMMVALTRMALDRKRSAVPPVKPPPSPPSFECWGGPLDGERYSIRPATTYALSTSVMGSRWVWRGYAKKEAR